jgi:hypothetical protein
VYLRPVLQEANGLQEAFRDVVCQATATRVTVRVSILCGVFKPYIGGVGVRGETHIPQRDFLKRDVFVVECCTLEGVVLRGGPGEVAAKASESLY